MSIARCSSAVSEAIVDNRERQLIPGMEHFSGGRYSSPEGLHGGYTHGFLMTFRDAAARDGYLPHPEHERVKNAILPHIDGVIDVVP